MVTKKIRTEYMKKFRDPRWETFSKCYEDSLKYRLTRRVMESSHKPWIWEGWDNCSESSGRSTPRLTRNKVLPLSVKPSTSLGVLHGRSSDSMGSSPEPRSTPEPKPPFENGEADVQAKEALCLDAAPTENGVNGPGMVSTTDAPNTSSDDTATDDGPLDRVSSDEEPVKPEPKRRHRHRTPRSEPGHRDSSHDDKPAATARKTTRAKSQPPVSNREKENRRPPLCRYDWTEKHSEVRKVPNETRAPDVRAQTRRESDKRGSHSERRRARSADLEKLRKSELTVVDDRWITEYMRCFSARLR